MGNSPMRLGGGAVCGYGGCTRQRVPGARSMPRVRGLAKGPAHTIKASVREVPETNRLFPPCCTAMGPMLDPRRGVAPGWNRGHPKKQKQSQDQWLEPRRRRWATEGLSNPGELQNWQAKTYQWRA